MSDRQYRYFIGIDPGANGAVAVIDASGNIQVLADLPRGAEDRLDASALASLLQPYSRYAAAVLERPTAFTPNAYAMMALGCSFGMCLATLQCQDIAIDTPTPRAWKCKSAMNLTADKKESVERARALFEELPKRLRHDKAEALLLAEYCRRCCQKNIS